MNFFLGVCVGVLAILFYRSIFTCKHDWISVEKGELHNESGNKLGIYETYKCTKCLEFRDEESN